MSNCEQIWKDVLQLMESSEKLKSDSLSWIKKARLAAIEYDKVIITYNSVIAFNILNQNQDVIAEALSEVLQEPVELVLEREHARKNEPAPFSSNPFIHPALNQDYTFESFVEGSSNQEALLACKKLAQKEKFNANPLLLYGDSGLGKTHLLHALGNALKEQDPEAKVIYMYAGDFVTLLIEAMRNKNPQGYSVEQLKGLMLEADYFLIDDIQNLQQASSQEVFFSLFNKLLEKKAHIILTSDIHPSQLANMPKRLISRFVSGLPINIDKPGFETARKILKKKMEGYENALEMKEDVYDFLALQFAHDVRSLEGALNRLLFNTTLFNPEIIDMEFARQVLSKDVNFSVPQTELDLTTIKKSVAKYYGLTVRDMDGKARLKTVVTARQVFVYLCKKMLSATFTNIGFELGKRDHSTIANAYNKAKKRIEEEPLFEQAIESIQASLIPE